LIRLDRYDSKVLLFVPSCVFRGDKKVAGSAPSNSVANKALQEIFAAHKDFDG
jgi:hypothetical protein